MQASLTSLKSLLRRSGLDAREAEIYLTLLPLKKARVSTLAKIARQPRPLTYAVLKRLEARGLLARLEQGKILHVVAEPPERLYSMLEERRRESAEVATLLKGALPFFHALQGEMEHAPAVTMLSGREGMRSIYREALAFDICGCGNAKTMWDHYGMSACEFAFGRDFSTFAIHGHDLLVRNRAARWFIRDNPLSSLYQVRLLPKSITFIADSLIYGDTVALFAYDSDLTIVRIENHNIANYHRALHRALWTVSERVGEE